MFRTVPSGSQITENQLDSLIRFRTWRFFPGIRPKMASRVAMLSFSESGFAAWGCEGPEIVPVAQSHRTAGRQALEVEDARGKSVRGVP